MKRTELTRHVPLVRKTELRSSSRLLDSVGPLKPRGSGRRFARQVSPASPAQRQKCFGQPCVVCGLTAESIPIDPAHLAARGGPAGGCDDEACCVPCCRAHHRLLDDGKLDVLPFLVGRFTPELCHALGHYEGDLLGLLHRLTGDRYVPTREAA